MIMKVAILYINQKHLQIFKIACTSQNIVIICVHSTLHSLASGSIGENAGHDETAVTSSELEWAKHIHARVVYHYRPTRLLQPKSTPVTISSWQPEAGMIISRASKAWLQLFRANTNQ